MRKMEKQHKQVKMIVITSLCLLFILTVGYAAFSTTLNIHVKGNVKDNTISTADLTKSAVSTGNALYKSTYEASDGLYASTYESGRYIYRGADPDNYITFNDETWRIMSVESDGTLKIRRASSIGSLQWDVAGNRSSSTSTYCTSSTGCNAWATTNNLTGSPLPTYTQYYPNGNPSDSTTYSGTVTSDSTMNSYLNGTYYNTLSDDAKALVVNGTFDVSTPGNPSDTEDMATNIEQAKQYQWNGKVALMTILEWMQTSTDTECTTLNVANNSNSASVCSNNNWLFDSNAEWTLSPYNDSQRSSVWVVDPVGYASSTIVSDSYTVNPVLYLSSDIKLLGSGTSSDPYIINP